MQSSHIEKISQLEDKLATALTEKEHCELALRALREEVADVTKDAATQKEITES